MAKVELRSIDEISRDILHYGPKFRLQEELRKARNRANAERSRKRRKERIDKLMQENKKLKEEVAALKKQLSEAEAPNLPPLSELFNL